MEVFTWIIYNPFGGVCCEVEADQYGLKENGAITFYKSNKIVGYFAVGFSFSKKPK